MDSTIIATAILGGLIGGGTLSGVFYWALRGRLTKDLGETFATVADLNGVGTRVNAFETVLVNTRDAVDANSDRLTKIEAGGSEHSAALSRTLTRIDARLDELDNRQRAAQSEIARTVAVLDALEKRMDRHSPHD